MKTSSLGDVVHHCPAVSDAARRVPGAQIDWMVEEGFTAIPAMHPRVRRVIPVAVRRWRGVLWHPSAWSEITAFRRTLREERYDAVIDSQGLLKSALVSTLAGVPLHGLDRASVREPLAARFYARTHAVPKGLHAVERNRHLAAAALGYALEGAAEYGLRPQGIEAGKGGEARKGIEAGQGTGPYAVFLTMTSRADKLWPEARWIELGRALGVRVVLPWGSDEERARAQRIAQGIGKADVPPRMEFGPLSSLLSEAQCVVGLDTGLTHLAVAVGASTVGIFCGSDPALTGLYGSARAVNLGAAGRPPGVADVMQALARG